MTLEVTETEALKDLSQLQKVIEKCSDLGIRVILDDFGTGQASLTSLQYLSVGGIKIDQGFVGKIRECPKAQAIVSSLVSVCQMMQIEAIAEGVQDEDDGQTLIRMGCILAQGYAIARPMSENEIPGWISSWRPFRSWTKNEDLCSPGKRKNPEGLC